MVKIQNFNSYHFNNHNFYCKIKTILINKQLNK